MELSELGLAVLFLLTQKKELLRNRAWLERLDNVEGTKRDDYEQLKITLAHVDPMSRKPSLDNHGSHTPNRHLLRQAQQTRFTQSHIKVIPSVPQITG